MDLKCYGLAGQWMVRIQDDVHRGHLDDRGRHFTATGTGDPYLLTYFGSRAGLYPRFVHGDKHAVSTAAEGMLRLDGYGPRLADLHTDHRVLNACNEPLPTDDELKRSPPC